MRIIKNIVHNRYLIMQTCIFKAKFCTINYFSVVWYYKNQINQTKVKSRTLREKYILQSHCLDVTFKIKVLSNIYLPYPNVDVTCKISSRCTKEHIEEFAIVNFLHVISMFPNTKALMTA